MTPTDPRTSPTTAPERSAGQAAAPWAVRHVGAFPAAEDLASIRRIFAESFPDEEDEDLVRGVEERRWDLWVADGPCGPAGFAAVRHGRLAYLGVAASHRSRGVGSLLLGALMAAPEHAGGLTADIEPPHGGADDERRLRFYLRHGAEVVDRDRDGWELWIPPQGKAAQPSR